MKETTMPTMEICQWHYDELVKLDPKGRSNPQSYGRELLGQKIMEEKERRRNTVVAVIPREEPKPSNVIERPKDDEEKQKKLRLLAKKLIRLLALDGGLFVKEPPEMGKRPKRPEKEMPCTFTKPLLAEEENYDPPNVQGKPMLWARFMRMRNGRTIFDKWLPIEIKYNAVARMIVKIQKEKRDRERLFPQRKIENRRT